MSVAAMAKMYGLNEGPLQKEGQWQAGAMSAPGGDARLNEGPLQKEGQYSGP